MLRPWVEWLPLFIVRRLARRCERVPGPGGAWRDARPGVLIRAED